MEQNKVEILEALNNEKMYSLRGDEVGEMCSPEGNDTLRGRGIAVKSTELNTEKGLKTRHFRAKAILL